MSIQSASNYLNSLLLARGLLVDGKSIDFADTNTINLVHHLILHRDRDTEQNENIVSTIKELRATEKQHVLAIQQAQHRTEQLRNDLATAEAQERATHTSLKRLEIQVRDLKEQNLKMKSMVDQVRAKCTSDVRKRDVEVEKLKNHLTNLQRGKQTSMKINIINTQSVQQNHSSLEKDTNDFLANLVNEATSDNILLRSILVDTSNTLGDLTGCDGIETNTTSLMAEQMKTILQHCTAILKDPSFVPVEEVHIRDAEILKMANRWKEAVIMMKQWKQKMDDADLDPNDYTNSSFNFNSEEAEENHDVSREEAEDCEEGTNEATPECLESQVTYDHSELEPAAKRIASSPAKRGVRLPRTRQPLSQIDHNLEVDVGKSRKRKSR